MSDRVLTLAGLRFFDHYPEQQPCPLCGTSEDVPCILIGMDGTIEGDIEKAMPVHVRCMADHRKWRINRNVGVIYAKMEGIS